MKIQTEDKLNTENWHLWHVKAQHALEGHKSGNKWQYVEAEFTHQYPAPTEAETNGHFQARNLLRMMISDSILIQLPAQWSCYQIWNHLKANYGGGTISYFNNKLSEMVRLPTQQFQDPRALILKWSELYDELTSDPGKITIETVYKMMVLHSFKHFNPGFEMVIQQLVNAKDLTKPDIVTQLMNAVEEHETDLKYTSERFSMQKNIIQRLGKRKAENEDSSQNKNFPIHDRFVFDEMHSKWCDRHCWNMSHETAQCKMKVGKFFTKPRFDPSTKQYERPQPKSETSDNTTKYHYMFQLATKTDLNSVWFLDTCGSLSITSDLRMLQNPEPVNNDELFMVNGSAIKVTHKGTIQLQTTIDTIIVVSHIFYSPDVSPNTHILSLGRLEMKGLAIHIENGILTATQKGVFQFSGKRTTNACYTIDLYCDPSAKLSSIDQRNVLDSSNKSDLPQNAQNTILVNTTKPKKRMKITNEYETNVQKPPNVYDQPTLPRNPIQIRMKQRLTLQEAHNALAHCNSTDIVNMIENKLIDGIELLNKKDFSCEPCCLAKSTRKPFPKQANEKDYDIGESLHMDTNFANIPSLHGATHTVVITDYTSRMSFCNHQILKSETPDFVIATILFIQNQTGNKVKVITKDKGTEFLGLLSIFIRQNGIRVCNTLTAESTQNGIVERMHRTLWNLARASLIAARCPEVFWDEVFNYALFTSNRTIKSFLAKSTTPYEVFFKQKPNLSSQRPFGVLCFLHLPKQDRASRASATSVPVMLLGYPSNEKGFRVFDPQTQTFIHSHHIQFVHPQELFVESHSLLLSKMQSTLPSELLPNEPTENTLSMILATLQYNESNTDTCAPKGYQKAITGPNATEWKNAIDKEVQSYFDHEAVEYVDYQPWMHLLICVWVFKIKIADNLARIFKARCTIDGSRQIQGLEFQLVYSPTISIETIRLVLGYTFAFNFISHAYDVQTAFLYGQIDQNVYMKIPPGFPQKKGKVLLLRKAVYGMKQSPRIWNKLLTATMLEFGMKQSITEPCLFYQLDAHSVLETILFFWVDDIYFFTLTPSVQIQFDAFLKSKFKIHDLGAVSKVINITVTHVGHKIYLNQKDAIKSALTDFALDQQPHQHLPIAADYFKTMTPDILLQSPLIDPKGYQALIGTALWISQVTRPDIATAVSILASAAKAPRKLHLDHLQKLFGYLKRTQDFQLQIGSSTDADIYCFADSDYANDTQDYDSRYGFALFVFGTLIAYTSHKEGLIPDSTTYAEYIALHKAINMSMFIQKLLQELHLSSAIPHLFTDNQSTLKIAQAQRQTFNSKHFATKYHRTKMLLQTHQITLTHVSTTDNVADIFTKTLNKNLFPSNAQKIMNPDTATFKHMIQNDTVSPHVDIDNPQTYEHMNPSPNDFNSHVHDSRIEGGSWDDGIMKYYAA